jgi:hypothetical protein
VDVDTLSNYVNLCLDFLLLSFFSISYYLFIIVVYGNNVRYVGDVFISFLYLYITLASHNTEIRVLHRALVRP